MTFILPHFLKVTMLPWAQWTYTLHHVGHERLFIGL
jgi:hypothetical protein